MAESPQKVPLPNYYPSDNASDDNNGKTDPSDGSLSISESNILQDRQIGVFGAISLIVNKIVGAGIFSTPASIFKLSGSPGMALVLWVIAGIISTCGAMVMLEFGSSLPRSGGIKVYLERSFSPTLLMTCIYLFYCVILQVSASNAITASSYLLKAAGVASTTWKLRGLAIAATGFAVGVHTVAPRIGRGLQDVLSAVKLFTLLFIVCTGFAALGGHLKVPKPDNFNIHTSFKGTSNNGYNIGTALLDAIFSFQGYDNLNMVLSEVKNPKKTLRIALPTAMGSITVLYILANVAYFAGVPRKEFIASDLTIAATLFRNVFGQTAASKALPALVAISAIGHLLGIAYTVPRVIQELAKDGITPFPNIVMQNRPFKTPIWALLIHLGVTIIFICAPPAGDAFNFIVSLASYPTTFLFAAITIGLVRLRLSKSENFSSAFTVPWVFLAFYLAANLFLLIMPFVRPPNGKGSTSLPYWLSPVVALAILSLGIIYYLIRFILLPWIFGYKLRLTAVQLRDGSQVSRYKIVKS
ncbi:methionine permease [Xylona heveae TC161]|uniref:Methionine permease n=1 Tax=Xylona heveae (strain CBS 132557 / TC161) TaxID=1328760 RepID=A0A164ZJV1_XYLHT|nr:methionine permease [Xylona heveae TC161]KZF19186.1 methionine permease [Xylona heveae TC161]